MKKITDTYELLIKLESYINKTLFPCDNNESASEAIRSIIVKAYELCGGDVNCMTFIASVCFYICFIKWNIRIEDCYDYYSYSFMQKTLLDNNIIPKKNFIETDFNDKDIKNAVLSSLKEVGLSSEITSFTGEMIDIILLFTKCFEAKLYEPGKHGEISKLYINKIYFYTTVCEDTNDDTINIAIKDIAKKLYELNEIKLVEENGIEIVPYFLYYIFNYKFFEFSADDNFKEKIFNRLKSKEWKYLNPYDNENNRNQLFIEMNSPCIDLCLPFIKPPASLSDFMIRELNNELEKKNAELEKTNAELEKAQKEKQAIVTDFTHRYKSMNADGLFDVAQSLLEQSDSIENMTNACKILLEFNTRQNLRKDIYMLSLFHKNEINVIYSHLKESISFTCDEAHNKTISDVIQESLSRVLIRLLVKQTEKRCKKLRHRMIKMGIPISVEMRIDFLREIIKNNKDCIAWIKKNLGCNLIINIDDCWKKYYITEYQFAHVLLTNQLTELFFNAFCYADPKEPINVEFTSDDNYLYIKSDNKILEDKVSGTQEGITSMATILNKLNAENDSVIKKQNNESFEIKLKISRKYFTGVKINE